MSIVGAPPQTSILGHTSYMSISCNLFIYFEFICTCRYVAGCYHAENKYVSIIVHVAKTLTTGHLNKWNLLMQECSGGGGGGERGRVLTSMGENYWRETKVSI